MFKKIKSAFFGRIPLADDTDGIILNLYHRQLGQHIESVAEVGKIRAWDG